MLNYISFRKSLFTMALVFTTTVSAHEVWLERDNNGSVRVYLGEPGEPDSGKKIDNLKAAQVFTNERNNTTIITQKNDHWEAMVSGSGDVRLFADKIWQPWAMDEKKVRMQGAILEARAGRTETFAKLNFELVPTTTNGNMFTAIFQDKPLAEQVVMVITPGNKELKLTTNSKGQVAVKLTEKGRYLLSSTHSIDIDAMHSGKKVDSLMYITSLTFLSE